MDSSSAPSHRRPRSESHLLAAASSSRTRRPSLQTHGSAARTDSDGPASVHFDALSSASSRRSRTNSLTADGPATAHVERSRRPSIRIRRSSLGLTGGQQPQQRQQQQQQHAAVVHNAVTPADSDHEHGHEHARGGRPRSISQPGSAPAAALDGAGRLRHLRRPQPQLSMPRLTEEGTRPTMAELGLDSRGNLPSPPHDAETSMRSALERSQSIGQLQAGDGEISPQMRSVASRRSFMGRMFRPGSRRSSIAVQSQPSTTDLHSRHTDEYNEELVDWLDIIDPEIQTLSTLTNVQNSLFVPDLGSLINRRPTYVLSQPDLTRARPASVVATESAQSPEEPTIEEEVSDQDRPYPDEDEAARPPGMRRATTITSRLSDTHYAALPHGETLEGWSAEEKRELDDHVRHMLHSRRSKFKRQMKGFGQYVRRPLGFFVTLYAILITLFGLAWVLFLIGWIYVGEQQVYAIHIIDSVLVALFAIMGDGLAPFRAVDTYHMIFIARYARIIAKAKKKAAKEAAAQSGSSDNGQSPTPAGAEKRDPRSTLDNEPITNTDDDDNNNNNNNNHRGPVPSITVHDSDHDITNTQNNHEQNENENSANSTNDIDLEDAKSTTSVCSLEENYLTSKQRKSLAHHQDKLSKSHSFYKPHETFTHHAFPLSRLIAVIILLDCHSCLQISLGATTWGIDYHHRPFAITTVILCVSITCNLTAGLVIMFGDRKTRKKDVVDLLDRQALTGAAMKKVEKKRNRGQETDGEGILTEENHDG
ncbi:hypothetical protein E4U21_000313 [Claviceps maximensis]|nr:hypothetical protein E4U21_000313 [Claviceps maximensis]